MFTRRGGDAEAFNPAAMLTQSRKERKAGDEERPMGPVSASRISEEVWEAWASNSFAAFAPYARGIAVPGRLFLFLLFFLCGGGDCV